MYAESAEYGKYHCRQDGVDAGKHSYAYASKRGMGDTATDKDKAAGYDVGSYETARMLARKAPARAFWKNVYSSMFMRLRGFPV